MNDTTIPQIAPVGAVSEPSAAGLTELSPAEEIQLTLRFLAERELDELSEDVEMKQLQKRCGASLKLLRGQYKVIREQYQLRKRASEATPEQLAADNAKFAEQEAAKKLAEQLKQTEDAEVLKRVLVLQSTNELQPMFHKQLRRSGYLCDVPLAATLLMTHAARYLETSTAFVFYGPSGSGKSDGVLKAAAFLPTEVTNTVTSMSEQALNYFGDLKNTCQMFGEIAPQIDGQDDPKQMILRQLISEDKITRKIVVDGVLVTKVTEGPCVITATTTKPPSKFDDQFQNRISWVYSNDSEETTGEVLDSIAARAQNPIAADDTAHELDVKAWQEFHRSLKPMPVKIPFAGRLADLMKTVNRHVTARRLYNLVLNYIRANALLHQHSRHHEIIDGIGVLVATRVDYEAAYLVLDNSAPRVLETCSLKARKVFEDVLKPALKASARPLPSSEIARILKVPPSTVSDWIKDYVKEGLVNRHEVSGAKWQFEYSLNADSSGFTTQNLGLVSPSVLFGDQRGRRMVIKTLQDSGWAL